MYVAFIGTFTFWFSLCLSHTYPQASGNVRSQPAYTGGAVVGTEVPACVSCLCLFTGTVR